MEESVEFVGMVEVHGPKFISGWCAPVNNPNYNKPIELHIYFEDIFLRKIKTVISRNDTKEKYGVAQTGFWFPIHDTLNKLLPKGAVLKVKDINGKELSYISEDKIVPFGEADDGGKRLRELLEKGYYVNKSGAVGVPFGRQSYETKKKYLDSMDYAIRIFYERLGLLLFPHYGTLLGLARNGKFIDHDDDVDMSFIVRANTVKKVADIFYEIVDVLSDAGIKIKVVDTGVFQFLPQDNMERVVDVFISWLTDENDFYTFFNVGGKISVPLSYVWRPLEDRKFLVPRFYEDILSFTFGESWRQPDPLFQHTTPDHVKKIMAELKSIKRPEKT